VTGVQTCALPIYAQAQIDRPLHPRHHLVRYQVEVGYQAPHEDVVVFVQLHQVRETTNRQRQKMILRENHHASDYNIRTLRGTPLAAATASAYKTRRLILRSCMIVVAISSIDMVVVSTNGMFSFLNKASARAISY